MFYKYLCLIHVSNTNTPFIYVIDYHKQPQPLENEEDTTLSIILIEVLMKLKKKYESAK